MRYPTPILTFVFKISLLSALLFGLSACGGGRSDSAGTTPPPVSSTDKTAPTTPLLVSVSSAGKTSADLSWQISVDDKTAPEDIVYEIHLSNTANFQPGSTTKFTEIRQASSYSFSSLTANTQYYTKIVALDEQGNKAISNELAFLTAEKDSKRTAEPVHVVDDGVNTQINGDEVVYNSADLKNPVTINQILVSKTEDGGYLRKVNNVTEANGKTTVTTASATLADVFEEVSFSTETVIASPAKSTTAARGQKTTSSHQAKVIRTYSVGKKGQIKAEKRQVWENTGLTLIENTTPADTATHLSSKSNRQTAARVTFSQPGNEVTDGDSLSIEGAKVVMLNPGDHLSYHAKATVKDVSDTITIDKFELKSITHEDIQANASNYGVTTTNTLTKNGSRVVENKLSLYWVPKQRHVSDKPYKAVFRAKEDGAPGWDDTLEYTVYIYVTNGSTAIAPDEKKSFDKTSADGKLTLTTDLDIGFEPTITALGNLGVTGLKTAEVTARGKFWIKQKIDLKALASSSLQGQSGNFVDKKFIKIVMAGGVPIVISGRFTMHAEYSASALAALEVIHDFDSSYDIEVGVSYKDGVWTPHKKSLPIYSYRLTGDANGEITGEVRLVPDLKVSIYEAAYGNLKVEPYLNAEAAVEGHFKYSQNYTPATDFNMDWGADYRFTKLNIKGGVDVKIRMGLDIFAREGEDLVGYPSNDKTDFKLFKPVDNRPIFALPVLATPTIEPMPSNVVVDSRTIPLKTTITDIEHPLAPVYRALGKTPPPSLNPFMRETLFWSTFQSTGASFEYPDINDKTRVNMIYTKPAIYEVKVSGHSKIGKFIRQYEIIDIDLSDQDSNQIPDYWETKYGVGGSVNSDDPDQDGATNLQEFNHGTFPGKVDSDNDGIKDGWEIDHNTDPLRNDASEDPDHDGFSNLSEYNAGTDPQLSGSNPDTVLPNNPPTANAGSDQSVTSGDTVTLSGSGTDSDGSIAGYQWSQVGGSDLSINNADSATASFTAPTVGSATSYTLKLTVTDDDGATGEDSVTITVNPVPNHAPTANAGLNQVVAIGSEVTLSAAASSDPDGDTLTYAWTVTSKPSGSTMSLSDTSAVSPTFTADAAGDYILSLMVNDGTVDSAPDSVTITASSNPVTRPLNDTGITFGGNYPSGNNSGCTGETISAQDCSHGRDAQAAAGTLVKVGGGHAGFDFTKLDASGQPLADQNQDYNTQPWACVRDNHTGLVWEVKTPAGSGGIHDAGNTYRWGGKTAQIKAGETWGTRYNDWDTLVDGSNSESLCGFGDWRVPTIDELISIRNLNRTNPAIDTAYFPNTVTSVTSSDVWSSSPLAYDSSDAWGVGFYYGSSYYHDRGYNYRVRLVRGGE